MSELQARMIGRAREILRERGWTRGAGPGECGPMCAGVALSIASADFGSTNADGAYLASPVYDELRERGFGPSIARWNDDEAEDAEAVDELLAAAQRRAEA